MISTHNVGPLYLWVNGQDMDRTYQTKILILVTAFPAHGPVPFSQMFRFVGRSGGGLLRPTRLMRDPLWQVIKSICGTTTPRGPWQHHLRSWSRPFSDKPANTEIKLTHQKATKIKSAHWEPTKILCKIKFSQQPIKMKYIHELISIETLATKRIKSISWQSTQIKCMNFWYFHLIWFLSFFRVPWILSK